MGRADLAERGRFDTWWIPNHPPRAKSALGPIWVERAIWYKVNPKSPSWSQISPRADLSGAGLIWIQITHLLIFTVFALLLLSRFCPMTPPLPTILEILASEHKQAIFGTPCTWKFFMSAFLAAKAQLNTCTCPCVCLSVHLKTEFLSTWSLLGPAVHNWTVLYKTEHSTVQNSTKLYKTVQSAVHICKLCCTQLYILNSLEISSHSVLLYTTVYSIKLYRIVPSELQNTYYILNFRLYIQWLSTFIPTKAKV